MYKRVIITRSGGPEVLKVIEEEVREPEKNEVRVRVSAAGLSFADIMKREGKMPGTPKPPFTPGYSIVGRVDKIGESINGFEVGQIVTANIDVGGYTQYAYLPPGKLISVPNDNDPFQTVCLPLNYLVAYQMLHRVAGVKNNNSILVHGAGGGVGTAFLDLGKLLDLRMFCTASAAKREIVEAYGGQSIDYRTKDFVSEIKKAVPEGVDAAFDPMGGQSWKRSNKALKRGGILVAYGLMTPFKQGRSLLGFAPNFLTLAVLMVKPGKRVKFFALNVAKQSQQYHEDLNTLVKLLGAGKIKPRVGKVFPLEEAAQAHKLLFNAEIAGAKVLDCR